MLPSTLTASPVKRAIARCTATLGALFLVWHGATGAASVVLAVSASGGTARTYTTRFPLTENPISEGGNRINGKKDALDWTDVRTISGFAFGTELGGVFFFSSRRRHT